MLMIAGRKCECSSAILRLRMSEANPFQDPLRFERRVPPCAIVIFGANGDLTKRKLIPALYRLAFDRRLPASYAILGNSRTAMSDDDFRARMRESVEHFSEDGPPDPELWDRFAANLFYHPGDGRRAVPSRWSP